MDKVDEKISTDKKDRMNQTSQKNGTRIKKHFGSQKAVPPGMFAFTI